ncbi:hypothetical protein H5407_09175 [Mitsuaria sp. WAJ17]|uniref:hypothetical protein n=1 Tax=Mitsuaria sp. WAJ17 TaxID=2761452 RepID=UPI0016018413|nr:hypothetical protein [Mitsuaria sp. WAJ17]MBB2485397.1 hypothetical protein [Mitsuaria sp. WAJ17]
MNAGLPNSSQVIAPDIEIGQHVPFYGALNYFKSGQREYLRSGFLRAFSAAYAGYVARVPAGAYVDIPSTRTGAIQTAEAANLNAHLFYDGTRYVSVTLVSNGAPGAVLTTDLSNWSAMSGSSSLDSGSMGAAQAGANGTIALVGIGTATGGIYKTSASSSWSQSSGLPGGAYFSGIAFNPAGTLGLAVMQNALLASAGSIRTTANGGGSYTSVTPSGGSSVQIAGVHYSPAAGGFLVFNMGNQFLNINKTTDGTNFTNVLIDTAVRTGVSWELCPQKYIASSPTVTLVSCANGKLKRTTDGTTWTTVDLTQQNGCFLLSTSSAAYQIFYNAVEGRFYANCYGVYNAVSAFPFLVSTDGINWVPSFSFRDTASLGNVLKVEGVNGKSFACTVLAASLYDWKDISTAQLRGTPDWVGSLSMIFGYSAGASPYSHVRIA